MRLDSHKRAVQRKEPSDWDLFLRHHPQNSVAFKSLARSTDELGDDSKVVGLATVDGRVGHDPVVPLGSSLCKGSMRLRPACTEKVPLSVGIDLGGVHRDGVRIEHIQTERVTSWSMTEGRRNGAGATASVQHARTGGRRW